jgi:AraC-like DNA-binding protein
MKREFYRYIYNNRVSGFHHPTRENIMGAFYAAQSGSDSIESKVDLFFSKLNGEQGVLNDSDLTNLHYTLVNDCFYFCEYLLSNNVDNELVYNSSDYYINQISSVKTRSQAKKFYTELAETFFELSTRKRLELYSFHIEKSVKYIDQKLYTQLTLNDVAKNVGLTPQYLTTLFRQETGKTLYQYIAERKIDESKMLLLYTSESMTTIASSLGFSSSAHFSSVFRRLTGHNPTEYRNMRVDMFRSLPNPAKND